MAQTENIRGGGGGVYTKNLNVTLGSDLVLFLNRENQIRPEYQDLVPLWLQWRL